MFFYINIFYMFYIHLYLYIYLAVLYAGHSFPSFLHRCDVPEVEHPFLAMALPPQKAPHQPGTANISNTCMILYKVFCVHIFLLFIK